MNRAIRMAQGCGTLCRIGLALVLMLIRLPSSHAQAELRADKQIAAESGQGTLTVKRGPEDKLYVLNRSDRCVWVINSSGTSTGRISSAGMGTADLIEPKDLAVDRAGNTIVADGSGVIKIFANDGRLLSSFPFKRPQYVGVLSDGRILVSGFPVENLISVFDRQGRLLGGIGQPVKVEEDAFLNSIFNHGSMVVDGDDNIYYVFKYLLTPTVRKYSRDGQLLAEWHPQGNHVDRVAQEARKMHDENKAKGESAVVPILAAAAFDEQSKSLWVAAGPQLSQVDSEGRTVRNVVLLRPDGRWLQAQGLVVDRDAIRASTVLGGTFEFFKPR